MLPLNSTQPCLCAACAHGHSAAGHPLLCRPALFRLGSKVAHTCGQANTEYYCSEGFGCHVALRDIAEGELLTTSYLQRKLLLMPTPLRHGLVICNVAGV